jgi:hypothetical protein
MSAAVETLEPWQVYDKELKLVMQELREFDMGDSIIPRESAEVAYARFIELFSKREESFFSIQHFPLKFVPHSTTGVLVDASSNESEIPEAIEDAATSPLDPADDAMTTPDSPAPIQRPGIPEAALQSTDMWSGRSPSEEWHTNAAPVSLETSEHDLFDMNQGDDESETDGSRDIERATREYNDLSERIMSDISRVQSKLTELRGLDI